MPTSLEQSILKTLCWFSVFDRPITGFEVWKWLIEPERVYDLSEVYCVLESSEWLLTRISNQNGFFAIRLNIVQLEKNISTRQENFLDAFYKFKKVRRAVRFFSLFESVRAIAAVNSIAWWNTNTKSDIDLFLITKPGSIWSTRFWIVAPFILFGVRPGTSHRDPFCFSFFASRSALEMDHLRLKEGDHYFAFWIKSIIPLFDRDHSIELFHCSNAWTHKMLPNAVTQTAHFSSFFSSNSSLW